MSDSLRDRAIDAALRVAVEERLAHAQQAFERARDAALQLARHHEQIAAMTASSFSLNVFMADESQRLQSASTAADLVLRDCAEMFVQAIQDLLNPKLSDPSQLDVLSEAKR